MANLKFDKKTMETIIRKAEKSDAYSLVQEPAAYEEV